MEEARAVCWTTIKRTDGFEISVTIRDEDEISAIKRLNKVLEIAKENGSTPVASKSQGGGGFKPFPKKEIEYADYMCPKCEHRVIKGVTKEGKEFEKCETQKWSPATGKTGCSYFRFL